MVPAVVGHTSSCSDRHEMNNRKYKNCCNEHLGQGYYCHWACSQWSMEREGRKWEVGSELRLAAGQRFKDSSLLFGPKKGLNGLENSGELAPSFLSFPLSLSLRQEQSQQQQSHNKSLPFDASSLSIVGLLSENNEISIFPNDYLPQVMTTGNDQAAGAAFVGVQLRLGLHRLRTDCAGDWKGDSPNYWPLSRW